MRVLVEMARPGLELAEAVVTADGLPLLGRGTRLTRRHLRSLHASGVRVVRVVDDESLEPWMAIPTLAEFLRDLDARFAPVEHDRRQQALKRAVRDVYTDFLLDLEEPR